MIGSLKWPCISETAIIMEGARCGIFSELHELSNFKTSIFSYTWNVSSST